LGQGSAKRKSLASTLRQAEDLLLRGELERARKKFKAVIARAGASSTKRKYAAPAKNGLAQVHQGRGELARARKLYEESRALWQAEGNAFEVAIVTSNLGRVCAQQWDFDAAEARQREALKILQGLKKPEVFPVRTALAQLYLIMRRDREALALVEKNLRGLGPAPGKALARYYVDALETKGMLHSFHRKYCEATRVFQRSLKIRQKHLAEREPELSQCLHNLGLVCAQLGRPEAETYLEKSLTIRTRLLGKGHLQVSQVQGSLALLRHRQGKFAEAEELYRGVLGSHEASVGKDHPDLAHYLYGLARACLAQDKHKEAADQLDRARRLIRRHITSALPALPRSAQRAFLELANGSRLDTALALAIGRPGDTRSPARSRRSPRPETRYPGSRDQRASRGSSTQAGPSGTPPEAQSTSVGLNRRSACRSLPLGIRSVGRFPTRRHCNRPPRSFGTRVPFLKRSRRG
jgi:tetratricopeptide (TPR) repeat protein